MGEIIVFEDCTFIINQYYTFVVGKWEKDHKETMDINQDEFRIYR